MTSQADYQKIKECVIDPLKRHYGFDLEKESIEDYVEDLARYSAETLRKAMGEVRREVKVRPKPAHIFDACRNVQKASRSDAGGEGAEFIAELRNRHEERRRITWRYAYDFCNESQIGAQAMQGGYWSLLFDYVFDEAWRTNATQDVTIPNPLLERWKRIGSFLLKREAMPRNNPKQVHSMSPYTDGIDRYINNVIGSAAS